jgi:hypothetical protein
MHELKRFLRRRGIDANDLAAKVERYVSAD